MKIPSAEYDNAVRTCAFLGYKLSTLAAASMRTNTAEFLEELFDKCEAYQKKFKTLLDAEAECHRTVKENLGVTMKRERAKR